MATPFNSEFFTRGERSTNYLKWFERPEGKPYLVPYESGYEPYLLLRADAARRVRYDTRFVGYGFNKLSHVEELRAAGFALKVSAELYAVHTHVHSQVNSEHDSAGVLLVRNGRQRGAVGEEWTRADASDGVDGWRAAPAAAAGGGGAGVRAREGDGGAGRGDGRAHAQADSEKCGRADVPFRRNFLGASCIGQFYRKLQLLYGYQVRAQAAATAWVVGAWAVRDIGGGWG
jgi:hypothetical protein